MNQPWSHLPNAALIDRILADVRAQPESWAAVGDAAREAARAAARDAVRDAVRATGAAAWAAAWTAVRDAAVRDAAAREAAWDAARDAILALVAWDDCAHLLHTDPEQVRLMALLGHQPAILLYPACVALSKSSMKSIAYAD